MSWSYARPRASPQSIQKPCCFFGHEASTGPGLLSSRRSTFMKAGRRPRWSGRFPHILTLEVSSSSSLRWYSFAFGFSWLSCHLPYLFRSYSVQIYSILCVSSSSWPFVRFLFITIFSFSQLSSCFRNHHTVPQHASIRHNQMQHLTAHRRTTSFQLLPHHQLLPHA